MNEAKTFMQHLRYHRIAYFVAHSIELLNNRCAAYNAKPYNQTPSYSNNKILSLASHRFQKTDLHFQHSKIQIEDSTVDVAAWNVLSGPGNENRDAAARTACADAYRL